MIQKAHFGSIKLCQRFLTTLMVGLLGILLIYTILIFYFMYRFGVLKTLFGYVGLCSVWWLTLCKLDRLNVKTWFQVADDVTLLLRNHKDPNLNGLRLKFEFSALPFRISYRSRRYQLVQVPRNIAVHSGMVDDGK